MRWAGAGRARGVRGQHRGALGWGVGRAQAGTAGLRGRWAWRAGRRWGARARRGPARTGGRARQVGTGSARRTAWAIGARGLGAPGRAWARLVHWLGQFGAHAASLGFDLGF